MALRDSHIRYLYNSRNLRRLEQVAERIGTSLNDRGTKQSRQFGELSRLSEDHAYKIEVGRIQKAVQDTPCNRDQSCL